MVRYRLCDDGPYRLSTSAGADQFHRSGRSLVPRATRQYTSEIDRWHFAVAGTVTRPIDKTQMPAVRWPVHASRTLKLRYRQRQCPSWRKPNPGSHGSCCGTFENKDQTLTESAARNACESREVLIGAHRERRVRPDLISGKPSRPQMVQCLTVAVHWTLHASLRPGSGCGDSRGFRVGNGSR